MKNNFDHDMIREWLNKTSIKEEIAVDTQPAGEEAVHQDKPELPLDSVDQMIDSLLIAYESDSTQKDDLSLEGYLTSRLASILFEQDEEEEVEEDETVDDSEPTTDVAASPERKAKLDIDRFTGKVYRLLSQYNNLLDIESAIVNRAKNYLENTYDTSVANEFLNVLEQNYDVGTTTGDDDTPEVPYAIGAGPGLGGGA